MSNIELFSLDTQGAIYLAMSPDGVEQGRIALDFDENISSRVTLRNITTHIQTGFFRRTYEDYGGQGIGTKLLLAGMELCLTLARENLDATFAPEKDSSTTEQWYRNRKIHLKRNGHDLFGYVPAIIDACRSIINSYE